MQNRTTAGAGHSVAPAPTRFYSRDEFARLLGVSRRTVDRAIKGGRIPAVKPTPRRVLIPDTALALLGAQAAGAVPAEG